MSEIDDKRAVENWRHVLSTIGTGREISGEGIQFAMDQIVPDASGNVQTAAFAFGLLAKRITATEFDAAAEGMLSFARLTHDSQLAGIVKRGAVNIVRADGDGANTVSIFMVPMIVIAASGVPVLEHGNRAASPKSGGTDMLKAPGIGTEDGLVASPEHPNFYVRFLFVARLHPTIRFTGPVCRELAVPTVFSLLEPLMNPACPQASLIGCTFEGQMGTMASTFACRGQRALVVCGSDGLDEVTATDPTKVLAVKNGEVTEDVINPYDYGMEYSKIDALRGDDLAYNADIARRIWADELEGPIHDAVILNFAAIIAISRGPGGCSLKEAMTDSVEETKETFQPELCLDIPTAAMKS